MEPVSSSLALCSLDRCLPQWSCYWLMKCYWLAGGKWPDRPCRGHRKQQTFVSQDGEGTCCTSLWSLLSSPRQETNTAGDPRKGPGAKRTASTTGTLLLPAGTAEHQYALRQVLSCTERNWCFGDPEALAEMCSTREEALVVVVFIV